MKTNKKMWLGIGCGVVVIALIVGIILMAGGNGKQPNPTTPSGTTPSGDVTEPSGTEPNGTEPNIPEYTGPEDPDEPIVPDDFDPDAGPKPIDPDAPPVVDPDPTPSDPVEPEEKPDVKPPVDDPDVGDEIDFGGYTMGTLTADVWKSWDGDTREAFVDEFYGNATPEERHNFTVQTKYNGYTCGVEKHTCTSDGDHENFMAELARGCEYCGKSDCVSFWQYDSFSLFQYTDCTKCPEYDIHKDPGEYCQTCGMVKGVDGCIQFIRAKNCPFCSEWVEAWTCHHCEKD